MKLSDAIRLGAMTGPQCFSGYFGEGSSSCAMGSALIAVGATHGGYGAIWDVFPEALLVVPSCPSCGESLNCVADGVYHLNDDHLWTREAIADWVETVEQAQMVTPEAAAV
jgi:hypothetical protein